MGTRIFDTYNTPVCRESLVTQSASMVDLETYKLSGVSFIEPTELRDENLEGGGDPNFKLICRFCNNVSTTFPSVMVQYFSSGHTFNAAKMMLVFVERDLAGSIASWTIHSEPVDLRDDEYEREIRTGWTIGAGTFEVYLGIWESTGPYVLSNVTVTVRTIQ